jgi:hypothetical protein
MPYRPSAGCGLLFALQPHRIRAFVQRRVLAAAFGREKVFYQLRNAFPKIQEGAIPKTEAPTNTNLTTTYFFY